MKEHVGELASNATVHNAPTNVFAQGSQPAQPLDPTAQAPATRAPTTPPTFPTSKAKEQPDQSGVKVYMGTILKDGEEYVLKTGNQTYLLDSQKKAKNYNGKDVQLTGTLNNDKKLIHVEKIKVSPAM